jgi:stage III sporulation protein SpoIIIAA
LPNPNLNSNSDELELLLQLLPNRIKQIISAENKQSILLEVVLDLGRYPEIRFTKGSSIFLDEVVSREEIDFICHNVGGFSSENRAGIESTLHRISGIRNRKSEIIGLTCRVGRTLSGTVELIKDLLQKNKSILLLGPPGCGKTTKLREIAQIFADDLKKRVIIIDTSNEIGGDGDIPHPSIGKARRMPVIDSLEQHKVMIEAVENHTPEVIVVDEISTPEEALAAQTIAERGVILVATAHGRDLESIVQNPSLSILVGGSQAVTLSDEEAKRRKTQKSILERCKDATFEIVIEIISQNSVVVHKNVNEAVDQILRGGTPLRSELRHSHIEDNNKKSNLNINNSLFNNQINTEPNKVSGQIYESKYNTQKPLHIYPYAVSHNQIYMVIKALNLPAVLVDTVDEADLVIALEDYAQPGAKIRKLANLLNIQLETIQNNNFHELKGIIAGIMKTENETELKSDIDLQMGLEEVMKAIESLRVINKPIELAPRKASVRSAQTDLLLRNGFQSEIIGEGDEQRIKIIG